MNELDKYIIWIFLKFFGINEENIDNVIINILNKVVFKGMGCNIDILMIDCNYCVVLLFMVNLEIL